MYAKAGLTAEAALERARLAAPPWEQRDRRLLVAPMRQSWGVKGFSV